MRILFLGSNPKSASGLPFPELVQEVEESINLVYGESVHILRSTDKRFEDIPEFLNQTRPDILHITSHGETEYLEFSRRTGDAVTVTGQVLLDILPKECPRLVYLSACKAINIARALSETVPLSIGCSTSIKGVNSRHTSIIFLQRLLSGASVGDAFSACRAFLEAAQGGEAKIELFARPDISPSKLHLFPPMELIARFKGARNEGRESIQLGVRGCPGSVRQSVFYTTKPFWDRTDALDCTLCHSTQAPPNDGRIWATVAGTTGTDMQIFCSCTDGGRIHSATDTLAKALQRYYEETVEEGLRKTFIQRIAKMSQ